MARASGPTVGWMDAGRREVQACAGALRVVIPARIAQAVGLTGDDELRVGATADGHVVFHAAGVPFAPATALYAGNTSIVRHNGSLKAVLLQDAADAVGITAGDTVRFQYDPGQHRFRCQPVTPPDVAVDTGGEESALDIDIEV